MVSRKISRVMFFLVLLCFVRGDLLAKDGKKNNPFRINNGKDFLRVDEICNISSDSFGNLNISQFQTLDPHNVNCKKGSNVTATSYVYPYATPLLPLNYIYGSRVWTFSDFALLFPLIGNIGERHTYLKIHPDRVGMGYSERMEEEDDEHRALINEISKLGEELKDKEKQLLEKDFRKDREKLSLRIKRYLKLKPKFPFTWQRAKEIKKNEIWSYKGYSTIMFGPNFSGDFIVKEGLSVFGHISHGLASAHLLLNTGYNITIRKYDLEETLFSGEKVVKKKLQLRFSRDLDNGFGLSIGRSSFANNQGLAAMIFNTGFNIATGAFFNLAASQLAPFSLNYSELNKRNLEFIIDFDADSDLAKEAYEEAIRGNFIKADKLTNYLLGDGTTAATYVQRGVRQQKISAKEIKWKLPFVINTSKKCTSSSTEVFQDYLDAIAIGVADYKGLTIENNCFRLATGLVKRKFSGERETDNGLKVVIGTNELSEFNGASHKPKKKGFFSKIVRFGSRLIFGKRSVKKGAKVILGAQINNVGNFEFNLSELKEDDKNYFVLNYTLSDDKIRHSRTKDFLKKVGSLDHELVESIYPLFNKVNDVEGKIDLEIGLKVYAPFKGVKSFFEMNSQDFLLKLASGLESQIIYEGWLRENSGIDAIDVLRSLLGLNKLKLKIPKKGRGSKVATVAKKFLNKRNQLIDEYKKTLSGKETQKFFNEFSEIFETEYGLLNSQAMMALVGTENTDYVLTLFSKKLGMELPLVKVSKKLRNSLEQYFSNDPEYRLSAKKVNELINSNLNLGQYEKVFKISEIKDFDTFEKVVEVDNILSGKESALKVSCNCFVRSERDKDWGIGKSIGVIGLKSRDYGDRISLRTQAKIARSCYLFSQKERNDNPNMTLKDLHYLKLEVSSCQVEELPVITQTKKEKIERAYETMRTAFNSYKETEKSITNKCDKFMFFKSTPNWLRQALAITMGAYGWQQRGRGKAGWGYAAMMGVSYVSSNSCEAFRDGLLASVGLYIGENMGWGDWFDMGLINNNPIHYGFPTTGRSVILHDLPGMFARMNWTTALSASILQNKCYEFNSDIGENLGFVYYLLRQTAKLDGGDPIVIDNKVYNDLWDFLLGPIETEGYQDWRDHVFPAEFVTGALIGNYFYQSLNGGKDCEES